MEIKDFAGKHKLSGVEYTTKDGYEAILFTLDDVHYLATEDPNDGYRSTMNDVEVSERAPRSWFLPVEVVGVYGSSDDDIISFVDSRNGKVVLEIGTRDVDDYYPCCVMSYSPENFAVNG